MDAIVTSYFAGIKISDLRPGMMFVHRPYVDVIVGITPINDKIIVHRIWMLCGGTNSWHFESVGEFSSNVTYENWELIT